MKKYKGLLLLSTKVIFVFALVIFLNFSNIGSSLFLQIADAADNNLYNESDTTSSTPADLTSSIQTDDETDTQSSEPNIISDITEISDLNQDFELNTNLTQTLGPMQVKSSLQVSNSENSIDTKEKLILNSAADDFDPDAIPYFQSETVVPSDFAATITIRNRWNGSITVDFKSANDGSTLTTSIILASASATISFVPTDSTDLTISATNKDGFRSWVNSESGFISASGYSASEFSSFTRIPDMRYFTTDATGTRAGDYFFKHFFDQSIATSLPEGSFNTSRIISVGNDFFYGFNNNGSLTSLPAGSFNTSNIKSVGDLFFYGFNYLGSLTALPANSFNTSSITSLGTWFFSNFNHAGSLTSLPANCFNISNITSVGDYFFTSFNYYGRLTSLPANSFNTTSITSVGHSFFSFFNFSGSLTSLPANSFNISRIKTATGDFFYSFNYSGKLTSLPENSFNFSSLTSVSYSFFYSFNRNGSLTSLPANSFDTSNITSVGDSFFAFFNYSGSLTSLPANSFNTSGITKRMYPSFFSLFNYGGKITKNTSAGVSIKNPTSVTVTFYYSTSGSDLISSGSTFSFYQEDVPYFQTETVAPSAATTITINNRWDTTLTIDVQSATSTKILATYTVNSGTSSTSFVIIPTQSVRLAIYPSNAVGFRNWAYSSSAFITASGASASKFSSFTHIPDMSYFTTDSTGTQAGNFFFNNFFKQSKATSLPANSFDISTITSVGNYFFASFNDSGSLTDLPANSFNTSSIRSVGNYFFNNFNYSGSLTSLPANSFNTTSITSVGTHFFDSFNDSGSLTSLPAYSFNTSHVTSVGNYFFNNFNNSGQITKNPSYGVSIKNPTSSNVTFYYPTNGSDVISPDNTFSFYDVPSVIMSFDSNGGSDLNSITASQGNVFIKPVDPKKAGYLFIQWADETTNSYDWSTPAINDITLTAQWERLPYFQSETVASSIDASTITINNRWDCTLTIDVQSDSSDQTLTTYTVDSGATSTSFEITPSQSVNLVIFPSDVDGFRNWVYSDSAFITASGASASEISSFAHIPAMSYFTTNSTGTEAGNYFFNNFFKQSKATSLPVNSFNTSKIISVSNSFFYGFNYSGSLTALPINSFNTSSITTVGNYFFAAFNFSGSLTALPVNSFDISTITSVGANFFRYFNYSGSLTALPINSFNTSSITSFGDYFFAYFNNSGRLTFLPENSFNISHMTNVVNYFFTSFNNSGSLTSLPANSFNFSSITIVGNSFFSFFNNSGSLTSLPAYSFNTSSIKSVGNDFFSFFNFSGSLTSLPAYSFNVSSITSVGTNFFMYFNFGGQITKDLSTGISIKNPTSNSVTFYYPASGSDVISTDSTFSFYKADPPAFTMFFDSNGGSEVSPITVSQGDVFIRPVDPGKSGYLFIQWVDENTNSYDWSTPASNDITLTAQWERLPYFRTGTISTSAATTITINNRWNSTLTIDVQSTNSAETLATYTVNSGPASTSFVISRTPSAYVVIYPSDADGFRNWFGTSTAFITASATNVSFFSHIPDMTYFTSDSTGTKADDNFFSNFFKGSKATSLPAGSFDISTITIVGNDFFSYFNYSGSLTSLPANSFDTSSIKSVGNSFFSSFNNSGSLTALPANSFDTSSIKSVGNSFFSSFNASGSLTALPANSFDTSSIKSVGNDFFSYFNYSGSLTSLPANSFDTSSIKSVGNSFFSSFNSSGKLTALPANSFNISSITSVGNSFFSGFNYYGKLTTLPVNSFNTSRIESVGDGFFFEFTCSGSLTSLPVNSFNTSSITSVGDDFFYSFNWSGSLTSLPANSFNVSSITSVGDDFFGNFFHSSKVTSLPAGSFNTSSITTVGRFFFSGFNIGGSLTALPANSFNISSITSVGDYFFYLFNYSGSLTSLPVNSFNTSNITSVGSNFFYCFNSSGSLTSLPLNSFNISSITSIGNSFFSSFNSSGKLTSLPVNSFNTSSIRSARDSFFDSFNYSGSLTSLPLNSFNTSNITTQNNSSYFYRFNYNGQISKNSSVGISIKNPPSTTVTFYYAPSNSSDIISSGKTFSFYTADPDFYTISFNSNGGSDVSSITTIRAGTFTQPPNPTKFAYTFNQWVLSNGNTYDWNALASADITLTAQWNINPEYSFTISFDSNGGSEVSSITAQQGEKFIQPTNPTKSGYEFTEWIRQDGTHYDWNDTASGNITLYASWIRIGSPTITNISTKSVQNGKVSSVVITGSNLDSPSYSYGITATRFGNSSLSGSSKTFNKTYPSSSILNKTASSVTLKIPSTVGWMGSYTIQLLTRGGVVATETILTYQLPLGSTKNFSDISKLSSSRQDSVKWLAKTGVTGGCNSAGTKYCPDDPVNRGSMAAFLQLLAGYPSGSSKTSSFADVFAGSSKTVTYVSGSKTTKSKVSALSEKRIAAINWLAQTGITGGSGSAKVNGKVVNTYRPQDAVNRGSMASFMLKFSEDVVKTITSDAQTGFADIKIGSGNFTITYKGSTKGVKVAKLSSTRATAVKWMLTAGITGGSGTDKSGKVTYRAQDGVNRGSMATFMKNLAKYLKITS